MYTPGLIAVVIVSLCREFETVHVCCCMRSRRIGRCNSSAKSLRLRISRLGRVQVWLSGKFYRRQESHARDEIVVKKTRWLRYYQVVIIPIRKHVDNWLPL